MMQEKLKVVLMGTGPFAVPSFEAIRKAGHDIVQVISRPLQSVKSRGGPPPAPVYEWASQHGLDAITPDSINDDETVALVASLHPDLLVVCDYGQILKPAALATARLGGINLHGSLLPRYRGAAPVQRALLSGDLVTGVSVIHMTPRLDGGPILTTRSTEIDDRETAGELEERLSAIGVEATLEAMEMLANELQSGVAPSEINVGQQQDASLVSKAPRLSKAEGQIDWTRCGREIDCHVRGMQPWPVAYSHISLKPDKPPVRIAVREVMFESDLSVSADQIGKLIDPSLFVVGCGDGRVKIERLVPAGKKEMSGEDFLRGHRPPAGTPLS